MISHKKAIVYKLQEIFDNLGKIPLTENKKLYQINRHRSRFYHKFRESEGKQQTLMQQLTREKSTLLNRQTALAKSIFLTANNLRNLL